MGALLFTFSMKEWTMEALGSILHFLNEGFIVYAFMEKVESRASIILSLKDRVPCNLHPTILRHLKSQNIMLQKRSLLTSMRTLCQVLTQIITCRFLKLNTSKLKSRSKIHHNLIIILTQITYPEMKNRSRIIIMNEKRSRKKKSLSRLWFR